MIALTSKSDLAGTMIASLALRIGVGPYGALVSFLIRQCVTLHFDMVLYVTANFDMLQSSLIWYRTVHFGALCYGTQGRSVSSGVLHIVWSKWSLIVWQDMVLASSGWCVAWCG